MDFHAQPPHPFPLHDSQNPGRFAFLGAHVVDPSCNLDAQGGVLVENGIILDSGFHIKSENLDSSIPTLDCTGKHLIPGLVDMRVFAGEPGYEHRETLATASQAAAHGGITTMIVMPNTMPVIDDVALVDFILRRARDTAHVHVAPMAALTKGLLGEQMVEIGLLKQAGALALTDGDRAVINPQLFMRALSYGRNFDMLIVQHVEDPALSSGVMAQGELATRLGLSGNPWISEVIILERDLRLIEYTGGRYHASQLSCAQSVACVRAAKQKGLPISCGVSINHLLLNELDIGPYRTFFKLSPPLRSEKDRRALIEGVQDGTIDVIVSSHDPQNADTKRLPFSEAAFGASGLDTFLGALLSLYHQGMLSLSEIVRAASLKPSTILGIPGGSLKKGMPADFVLLDLESSWKVDPSILRSRSKNSVFEHTYLQGAAVETFVNGRSVYKRQA